MEEVEKCSLLLAQDFHNSRDQMEKRELIQNFIKSKVSMFQLPEFPKDNQWINTTQHLCRDDFLGKLVLLDFFTYCCINCIHMLPFLHQLETRYPTQMGFAVVGIHSAKFPNEKDSTNIKNAINRCNICHPVLNDPNIEMWNMLKVTCWPTLIIVNPRNEVLLSLPGEAHADVVEMFIDEAMQFYKSSLSDHKFSVNHQLTVALSDVPLHIQLKFPGKVVTNKTGDELAISDSGNHRVIVCNNEGEIVSIIGNGLPGKKDGDFDSAQFNAPQGLAWSSTNSLYVADCENHLIRKIDFSVMQLVTLVGTGIQSNDIEGGKLGIKQGISSPWDLQVGGSPRFQNKENILYIAMAGVHQIWAFFLGDADWQKGAELKMMTCVRFAGSGREENRNNSYPHKAGFAQPSGIAISTVDHKMYVADSESSTIRKISLNNGATEAVVGGHFDPTNLFAFGDIDGKGRDVRLQHPLGVAWDHRRQRLYVSDTYNNKIKIVDPLKKTCSTFIGTESCKVVGVDAELYPAEYPSVFFNEPGGLCVDPTCERLYIADTNNHRIVVVYIQNGQVTELKLKLPDVTVTDGSTGMSTQDDCFKPLVSRERAFIANSHHRTFSPEQKLWVNFNVAGVQLTKGAPSMWQLSVHNMESPESVSLVASGNFDSPIVQINTGVSISTLLKLLDKSRIATEIDSLSFVATFEANLFYCVGESSVCSMKGVVCIIPATISPHDKPDDAKIKLSYTISELEHSTNISVN